MRGRGLALLLILVVVVGAGVYALFGGGTATKPRPAGPLGFGTDVSLLFQNRYPPAVVNRALASASQAGLRLARAAPLWEETEPTPPTGGVHHYDWRYDDFIAHSLSAHGLRWVAVMGFAPGWATVEPGVLHAAPRGTANYAAYAGAVARRYRGQIAAYEIWNEENTRRFWHPAPDPAAYARLYLAARAAIHREDPGAPVLIGGLAGGHFAYLRSLLSQPGMRGHVDGVAVHVYAVTPARVLAQVRLHRQVLDSVGFGNVPLYLTEYGWASRRLGPASHLPAVLRAIYAPPRLRGELIVQTARDVLRSGCNVRAAIFYAWLTPDHGANSVYSYYGAASPSGGPTPTSQTIAAAPRPLTARGATATRAC